MTYVKLAGTANRHEDWTTEYILERDEETGEVTKSAKLGVPVDLTADERKKLEEIGAVFEDSSAAEHKEYEEREADLTLVGDDTAAAAPLLGTGTAVPPPSVDQPSPSSPAKASGKDNDNK